MTFHIRSVSVFAGKKGSILGPLRGVSSLIAAIGLLTPVQVMAQAAPVCDGRLFLSQDSPTGLNLVSTATNPMTYTAVGAVSSITYNALGYSAVDGKLYAMRTDSGNANHLLTLDQSTGAWTDVGAISALPTTSAFNSGAVGSDGIYYVKPSGNTQVIYAINTGTQTFTTINLSQAFTTSDLAWVGGASGGLFSVADNGQLFSINATDGTVTAHGSPDSTGGVLGAQFGGVNGLFGSANNGSGFYQINLSTGKKTMISGSPGSGTNDGGNCPNAAIKFPADLSITKTNGQSSYTPGTNVVYTITVTNKGPFTATGATVTDALPGGISAATWSCAASAGASCMTSGTGGINDTITLPKDGTATYTLTMSVPASFTGDLVNTATVAVDGNSASAINESPDPDPSNDSATDTDTPKVPTTPGNGTATSVPTLGEWALMLLSTAMAGFAGLRLRSSREM